MSNLVVFSVKICGHLGYGDCLTTFFATFSQVNSVLVTHIKVVRMVVTLTFVVNKKIIFLLCSLGFIY